ncbi:MAG: SDR family oxidoreductase [Pirellulaceae bacterium]
MPFAGGAVCAMSKAALVGLVSVLFRDLGPSDITGEQHPAGPGGHRPEPRHGRLRRHAEKADVPPPARRGTGDEIASLVPYLATPEAAFVTGASLTIDGELETSTHCHRFGPTVGAGTPLAMMVRFP